jgi:hypothetical protein
VLDEPRHGIEELAGKFASVQTLVLLFGGRVEKDALSADLDVFFDVRFDGVELAAHFAFEDFGGDMLVFEMALANTFGAEVLATDDAAKAR